MPVRRRGPPELHTNQWRATRDALHSYAQVAGAIRAALSPPEKHWYHVSLRATAGGLTTTPVATAGSTFEITLELASCQWIIGTNAGMRWQVPLLGQSARELFNTTASVLGSALNRHKIGSSQLPAKPARNFDPDAARRYGQVLAWVDTQLKAFKAGQRGETSPVQLWPHHFDIAVLVFSGRKIPGTDPRDPEMSDEQMNFGFVPGDEAIREAYFYATAYPGPKHRRRPQLPKGAHWHTRGWEGAVMPYAALVNARHPERKLLMFLRAFRGWGNF